MIDFRPIGSSRESYHTMINKPRVLLVDDNDTDNMISRRVIELSNFAGAIDVCNSGKGALELIQSTLGNEESLPDLIFLDINMPIVDGFVFLYEFELLSQKISKQVDVVVLSSSDSRQDIDRMQLHPRVVDFITKPLSPKALEALKAA